MTDPPTPPEGGAPDTPPELVAPDAPPKLVAPNAPSPAERVAAALDGVDAAAALDVLDPQALTELAAMACGLARGAPDGTWLRRLVLLRGVLLQRNQRPAFAMVLGALADVCGALGLVDRQVAELGSLVGVRDLLGQPEAAWRACVALGRAQAAAGDTATAESTLQAAMTRARALPTGQHPRQAAARMAETMRALAELLAGQGRSDEAAIWTEGAAELDPG